VSQCTDRAPDVLLILGWDSHQHWSSAVAPGSEQMGRWPPQMMPCTFPFPNDQDLLPHLVPHLPEEPPEPSPLLYFSFRLYCTHCSISQYTIHTPSLSWNCPSCHPQHQAVEGRQAVLGKSQQQRLKQLVQKSLEFSVDHNEKKQQAVR